MAGSSIRRNTRVRYCALRGLLCREGWRVSLPSEAEWEKVARGTEGRIYPWGDKLDPERANYDETGINTISAMGCFPGGDLPYSCLDMAGNVWEWTRSLWGQYPHPTDKRRLAQWENLPAPEDKPRVLRGGAFWDNYRDVRGAFRGRDHPNVRFWYVGFRVVLLP